MANSEHCIGQGQEIYMKNWLNFFCHTKFTNAVNVDGVDLDILDGRRRSLEVVSKGEEESLDGNYICSFS